MDLGTVMDTMQGFLQNGTVRSIGVCNFNVTMLREAIEEIGAPIACHQIEYHAFLDQPKMLGYLREKSIPLVAHAPLAQGRAASDPVLQGIGLKHGVTAAQVALAWLLEQDGVADIPKAQRRESQKSNLDALAVKLDDDDRQTIAVLPKNHRFVTPPFAPQWDT
ncbi:aldo/keto reductase [Paraburkholderia sp. 40]|uniref:aldo/keto reductase n=1 Tax=Paraburkholderia sp. 40 TaxID=2991059 RepID=UPI003D22CC9B